MSIETLIGGDLMCNITTILKSSLISLKTKTEENHHKTSVVVYHLFSKILLKIRSRPVIIINAFLLSVQGCISGCWLASLVVATT